MWIIYQTPAIIESRGSSDSEDETDSESSETTSSCSDNQCNADETTAPGQPRPRDESPNSKKVVSPLVSRRTENAWLLLASLFFSMLFMDQVRSLKDLSSKTVELQHRDFYDRSDTKKT